jgi:prepilin-type N-terminal cleavage/methylation domain-containing protein/prepilin-type processing-associated H-X9-DG protein
MNSGTSTTKSTPNIFCKLGLSLVEMVVVLAIMAVLAGLLSMAILRSRAASRSVVCSNNLRQIGVAFMSYESAYRVFPPSCDAKGFSFHVNILPQFNRSDIHWPFRDFSYDNEGWVQESWKLPRSHGLSVYRCPDSSIMPFQRDRADNASEEIDFSAKLGEVELDFTSYLACMGSKTALPDVEYTGIFALVPNRERVRAAEVRNGLSQTLAVSEGAGFDLARLENILDENLTGFSKGIVYRTEKRYTDPDELANDCSLGIGTTAVPMVVGYGWAKAATDNVFTTWLPPNSRSCLNKGSPQRAPISASSHHGSYVNACFGDGSVRPIGDTVDLTVWQGMGRISNSNIALAPQ